MVLKVKEKSIEYLNSYSLWYINRCRTNPDDVIYALHLYFNSLSLRNTSIRDWIQKYKPQRLFCKRLKIFEFIIDETQIKNVGSKLI